MSETLPEIVWRAERVQAGYSEMEGVIHDIALSIRVGERVAVLGHEKSGRALLLRVLAGLRPFREGDLTIIGEKLEVLPFWSDWDEILPPERRRKMGVCLEREGLLSNVSAREGLELLFRFKYGDHSQKLRDGAKRVVNQLADKFGIGGVLDNRPHTLTSAEKRLVGLARAFLSKPSIIVLENPSENIGNQNRKRLLEAMEEICSQPERTLLVSTDDWPLAQRFCPRWIVMKDGRITFDGPSSEYLESTDELARQINVVMKRNRIVEEVMRTQTG